MGKDNTIENEKLDTQYCVLLWKKLTDTAFNIDNRNMSTLNLSTLIAGAALILTINNDNSKMLNYSVYLMPTMILIAFFYNAFNNKITAILKGYLSGIEEILNTELNKNLFQWSSRYIQIYRKPYFLSNDLGGIMFFIIAITIVIYSFIKMFQFKTITTFNKTFYLVFVILYLAFFAVFSIIFVIDTFSNLKTKQLSHDYFIANYNKKDFFENDQSNAELLKSIYTQYKKFK